MFSYTVNLVEYVLAINAEGVVVVSSAGGLSFLRNKARVVYTKRMRIQQYVTMYTVMSRIKITLCIISDIRPIPWANGTSALPSKWESQTPFPTMYPCIRSQISTTEKIGEGLGKNLEVNLWLSSTFDSYTAK